MKTTIALLLILLALPTFATAATCKIKALDYAGDWLSNDMKQAFAAKGYKLISKYETDEVDYSLTYELKTYGIYPCSIRLFTCVGAKRFATLKLQKENSSDKPVISLEESHKDKEWSELRDSIEEKFMKKITKLKDCK